MIVRAETLFFFKAFMYLHKYRQRSGGCECWLKPLGKKRNCRHWGANALLERLCLYYIWKGGALLVSPRKDSRNS